MLIETLLAASLLGQLRHPFGEAQQATRTYELGGWFIQVEGDRFSGQIRCHLSAPRMVFSSGAVRFRFSPKLNTLQAWYKVDSSAAQRWQDAYPALVELGASGDGPSLTNPTGGVVALPMAVLNGAREVTIRPTLHAQPRTFRLRGLEEALAAARRQGCTPDSAFVG